MENIDNTFNALFEMVEKELRSRNLAVVAGRVKARNLYHLAKYAAAFSGDFAEVGVYAGGTARIIAEAAPEKRFFAFDTFEGITHIDPKHDRPHFQDSFNHAGIEETARFITAPMKKIEIRKGWFPDTFYNKPNLAPRSFSFVHADADVYPSTMAICEVFWPRMVPGGVIVFDDYGYEDTPGARDAVNEYFKDRYETPSILTGGQAVVIKSDDYWIKYGNK